VGAPAVIEAENLGKCYRIYPGPLQRIAEGVTLGRYRGHRDFWALRGIDLKLHGGGSLGLCGANGAGKSTLLKVLAGTTTPGEGRFRIAGRVSSLLELGAGFHLDFTGRANIFLNGIMMGFSRREMASKVGEIIDFAELGEYIDEPVRTYSSGMGLRLGFAVAMAVDPDVMLIDEVFAVGDMYFQKKCVDKIYEFKQRNKTIVFCSHSLYDVRQLCDEALWLKDGREAALGDSTSVTNEYSIYQRHHIDEEAKRMRAAQAADEAAHREARVQRTTPYVVDARVYRDGTDDETYEINTGEGVEVRIWWRNPSPAETPIQLAVGFVFPDMTTASGMITHIDGFDELHGHEGCTAVRVPRVTFVAGQFLIAVILFDGNGTHQYQQYLIRENLVVRTATKDVGIYLLDHQWVNRTGVTVPTEGAPRIREADFDGTQGGVGAEPDVEWQK